MRRIIFIAISYIFIISISFAQEKGKLSVSTEFMQIKDKINQGLVFNGPQLSVSWHKLWSFSYFEMIYRPQIGIGAGFTRGITSIALSIKPADLDFMCSVWKYGERQTLKMGINLKANYNYQVYPGLHGGHLFWFTEIGTAVAIEYKYRWDKREFSLYFANSLFGFTSRPSPTVNSYDYSRTFGDFIKFAHQDMRFGSFNSYNHTTLQVLFNPNVSKRHSFSIGIDYLGGYYNPRFESLSYSFNWTILL